MSKAFSTVAYWHCVSLTVKYRLDMMTGQSWYMCAYTLALLVEMFWYTKTKTVWFSGKTCSARSWYDIAWELNVLLNGCASQIRFRFLEFDFVIFCDLLAAWAVKNNCWALKWAVCGVTQQIKGMCRGPWPFLQEQKGGKKEEWNLSRLLSPKSWF